MNDLPDKPLDENVNSDRRRFLRAVGLGTAAAGAAASMGQITFAQAQDGKEKEVTNAEPEYRETDHVRAFYATLRD